jgi:hypothetical protein
MDWYLEQDIKLLNLNCSYTKEIFSSLYGRIYQKKNN